MDLNFLTRSFFSLFILFFLIILNIFVCITYLFTYWHCVSYYPQTWRPKTKTTYSYASADWLGQVCRVRLGSTGNFCLTWWQLAWLHFSLQILWAAGTALLLVFFQSPSWKGNSHSGEDLLIMTEESQKNKQKYMSLLKTYSGNWSMVTSSTCHWSKQGIYLSSKLRGVKVHSAFDEAIARVQCKEG